MMDRCPGQKLNNSVINNLKMQFATIHYPRW